MRAMIRLIFADADIAFTQTVNPRGGLADGGAAGPEADGRGRPMKLIIAIIKPFKLDEVRDALRPSASRA